MRKWLKIWLTPLLLLVVWYVLSVNDWSFGLYVFSREMHDEFFRVYASVLGVEVSELPALLSKGLAFDGGLIAAFIAYRKRAVLVPWIKRNVTAARNQLAMRYPGSFSSVPNAD